MEVKFSAATVTVKPGAQPSFFAAGWFSLRQFRGQHLLDYVASRVPCGCDCGVLQRDWLLLMVPVVRIIGINRENSNEQNNFSPKITIF